jgi:uncharacterized protein YndB with AHSA1/START domain
LYKIQLDLFYSVLLNKYRVSFYFEIYFLELDKIKFVLLFGVMENTDNRGMWITRILKTPIALMWEVWTTPEHIKNWWGPKGFTSTIHEMNLKEGGEWKLTIHGPDGTNYPNRSIFKEIIPFRKIVFEHFNPHFFTTVLFESKGEETQINWSMLFDTAEMYGIIVKAHKADEGQKENIEKLEQYLSTLHRESKT